LKAYTNQTVGSFPTFSNATILIIEIPWWGIYQYHPPLLWRGFFTQKWSTYIAFNTDVGPILTYLTLMQVHTWHSLNSSVNTDEDYLSNCTYLYVKSTVLLFRKQCLFMSAYGSCEDDVAMSWSKCNSFSYLLNQERSLFSCFYFLSTHVVLVLNVVLTFCWS